MNHQFGTLSYSLLIDDGFDEPLEIQNMDFQDAVSLQSLLLGQEIQADIVQRFERVTLH